MKKLKFRFTDGLTFLTVYAYNLLEAEKKAVEKLQTKVLLTQLKY